MSKLIESPFRLPIRVYYEDTDAGGIVYHANYLNFAERARTEWLRSLGHDQTRIRAETGCFIVVRRASVDYKRPARLDDALQVECALQSLSGSRMTLRQRVICAEEMLAEVIVELVCVGENLRPAPWPEVLRKAFSALAPTPV